MQSGDGSNRLNITIDVLHDLFMSISWASSMSTECHNCPLMLTTKPPCWSIVRSGCPVFCNQFPPGWMSQCCTLEGMFLLPMVTLPTFSCCDTLYDTFVHQRRDEIATVTADHSCSQFDSAKNIVGKWRGKVINCHKCKSNVDATILPR